MIIRLKKGRGGDGMGQDLQRGQCPVHNRPGQNFEGLNCQTRAFLTMSQELRSWPVLAKTALKWSTSELFGRGNKCLDGTQNWFSHTFLPTLHNEVWQFIPSKSWPGLLYKL